MNYDNELFFGFPSGLEVTNKRYVFNNLQVFQSSLREVVRIAYDEANYCSITPTSLGQPQFSQAILPLTDNTITLGSTTKRWNLLFCPTMVGNTNMVISTNTFNTATISLLTQATTRFIVGNNGGTQVSNSATTEQNYTFCIYRGAGISGATLWGGTSVTLQSNPSVIGADVATNMFRVGDTITIAGETQTVTAIASNSVLTTTPWTGSGSTNTAATMGPAGLAFAVRANGQVGIAGVTPSAWLTIAAGTANLNQAPLKFTSGTNLTTPEAGAVEYDGSHLYVTIGSTRYQLDQQVSLGAWALTGTSTLTGVATIASNAANRHIFNGTWTTTASDQFHFGLSPSITSRATASDVVNVLSITPSITATSGTQVLKAVTINPTFPGADGTYNGNLVGLHVASGQLAIDSVNLTDKRAALAIQLNDDFVGTNLNTMVAIRSKRITSSLFRIYDNSNQPSVGNSALVVDLLNSSGTTIFSLDGRRARFVYGATFDFNDGGLYVGSAGQMFITPSGWSYTSTLSIGRGTTPTAAVPTMTLTVNSHLQVGWSADTVHRFNVNGDAGITGDLLISSLAVPTGGSAAIFGTAGTTTITYRVVARSVSGRTTASSADITVTTANATLSATNFVRISVSDLIASSVPNRSQAAAFFDIYRISTNGTSPTTLGKIGSINQSNFVSFANFDDTGLAGDGTTAPSVGTTGSIGVGTSTPSAFVDIQACNTNSANLRLRSGTTPTTPNDGDIWYNGTHLYLRVGSTSYQIDQQVAGSAPTLSQNQIAFGDASNLMTSSSAFYFLSNTLNVNSIILLSGGNISGATQQFTGLSTITRMRSTANVHEGNMSISSGGGFDTGGAGGQPTSVSASSGMLFSGAASVAARVSIRGLVTADLSAIFSTGGVNHSYTAFEVGQMDVKLAASGIHALLAQQVIKPLTVTTNGTSTVTNTATLYIEGASSATVTGGAYAIWTDAGLNRFDGNTSIGTNAAPTSILTLGAGTAVAGTAPLKFISGTNLTALEDGAVEYNGTHLYVTIGSTRYQLDQQTTSFTPSLTSTQIAFGGGGNLMTSSVNLVWDNTNNIETIISPADIRSTITTALLLKNFTAATAVQTVQRSPSLVLESSGWKTAAIAAAVSTDWSISNLPSSGITAPSSLLDFSYGTAGSYNSKMTLSDGGILSVTGTVTTSSLIGTASTTTPAIVTGANGTALRIGPGGILAMNLYGNTGNVLIQGNSSNSYPADQNAAFIVYLNAQPRGVGTNTAGGTTVTGSTTNFLDAFKIGDLITLGGETQTITAIASDTSMTTTAWTALHTAVQVNTTAAVRFAVHGNGLVGIGTASPTAFLHLPGSVAGYASLRIPTGTAPTSPNDGDMWYDGTNVKFRVGGTTKTFTLT